MDGLIYVSPATGNTSLHLYSGSSLSGLVQGHPQRQCLPTQVTEFGQYKDLVFSVWQPVVEDLRLYIFIL